jgi:hypothetical protein
MLLNQIRAGRLQWRRSGVKSPFRPRLLLARRVCVRRQTCNVAPQVRSRGFPLRSIRLCATRPAARGGHNELASFERNSKQNCAVISPAYLGENQRRRSTPENRTVEKERQSRNGLRGANEPKRAPEKRKETRQQQRCPILGRTCLGSAQQPLTSVRIFQDESLDIEIIGNRNCWKKKKECAK